MDNIDVSNGFANGTQATVEEISLKDISKCFHTLLTSDITVKSTYASNVEYIILKLKNGRTENETMKLEPKKMNFDATIPDPDKLLKNRSHSNNRKKRNN